MYDEGSLDYVGLQGLNPAGVASARRRRAGELLSSPLFSVGSLILSTRLPPFDDPRVRKAFTLAIDREKWANTVLDGLHFPASGGLIPPGLPGHAAGIALPFDPEQARYLLAEAGFPGGKALPEVSFSQRYWGEWSDRQESFLKSSWQEILGVEVSFGTSNWSQYESLVNEGKQHIYIVGLSAAYPDPDSILRRAFGRHRQGWQNIHYDELIERARRLTDQEERLRLYQLAETILLEEVPILPIYYRRTLGLFKPWVIKAPFDSLSEGWFWEDIVIEPH